MHGIFHSNGSGHLLCVNGLETGSNLGGMTICFECGLDLVIQPFFGNQP